MRNTIWTPKELAKVVLWQEQGTVLETTEAVTSGAVTVEAILGAAYRAFGFGRHKLKDSAGHILLPNVKFHKAKRALKVQDDEILAEVIKEPYTASETLVNDTRTRIIGEARPTVTAAGVSDILEAVKVLKDKTLSDIIAAFIAVSKEQQE